MSYEICRQRKCGIDVVDHTVLYTREGGSHNSLFYNCLVPLLKNYLTDLQSEKWEPKSLEPQHEMRRAHSTAR
jgi:hypothetical protein